MGIQQSSALGKQSRNEELSVALEELLSRVRTNDSTLTALDVPNSCVGDTGVETGAMALLHNSTVTALNLSFNGITGGSMLTLIKGMSQNNLITHLNLSGNKIGEEGCLVLGYFLAQNPALEELSLYHCGLTDACVHSLVNGLVGNTNLAVLRLEMNDLTNNTAFMFAQLFTGGHNDHLAVLGLVGNSGSAAFHADQMEVLAAHLQAAQQRYAQRKADTQSDKEHREALAEAAAKEAALARELEALKQDELKAMQEEQTRLQAEEDLALRERELEETVKRQQEARSGALARQEALVRRRQEIEQAMASAVKWREKLAGSGVREWRDGFTVMSTRPGDAPGAVPSLVPEPPRRLKACWCDPHDVAAPFAKTLHYHCKHETARQSLDEGDNAPRYQGCRASGHICASVGFFAKPLPDLSAAHFFASAHPATKV